MRILLHTDDHFKLRGSMNYDEPNARYSTRLDSLVESYKWIYEYARNNGVTWIMNNGDLLDKPVLLPEEGKALSEAFSYNTTGITQIILVGNHDRKTNELHADSIISMYPNITVIDTPQVLQIGNLRFSFLPFTTDYNNLEMLSKLEGSSILFSHVDFIGTNFGGVMSTSGFDPVYFSTHYPMTLNGHIHTYGKYSDNVINVGALTGTGLGDTYTKLPGIVIIDLDDNTGSILDMKWVPNPHAVLYYTVEVGSVAEVITKIAELDQLPNKYYLRVITTDSAKANIREYLSTKPSTKLLTSRVLSRASRKKRVTESATSELVDMTPAKSIQELLKDYVSTLSDKALPTERHTLNGFIDREFTVGGISNE